MEVREGVREGSEGREVGEREVREGSEGREVRGGK